MLTKQFKRNNINDLGKDISEYGMLKGYASVFDVVDLHNEIIVQEAFNDIDPSKIKLLWQHEEESPIGKILSIKKDLFGLYATMQLNLEVQKAKEAFNLIKFGSITGLSIGFRANKYHYNEKNIRVITSIDLLEISIVTFPANESATITEYKNQNLNNNIKKLIYEVDKLNILLSELQTTCNY